MQLGGGRVGCSRVQGSGLGLRACYVWGGFGFQVKVLCVEVQGPGEVSGEDFFSQDSGFQPSTT